jgi:predicted small secreted protein
MTSKNDITGDWIKSKPHSKQFDENWDRIFKKEGITLTEEELANVEIIADIVTHHHDKKKLPEYELDKSTGEVIKKNENT